MEKFVSIEKSLLEKLILSNSVFYLLIDIPHCFFIRLSGKLGQQGIITEFAYESLEISIIRWAMLVLIIFIFSSPRDNSLTSSIALSFFSFFWIIFFTKGKGIGLITGSFVYNFGIMELIAFLCLIRGVVLFQKLVFKDKIMVLMICVVFSIAFFFSISFVYPVEFLN